MKLVCLHLTECLGSLVAVAVYVDLYGPKLISRMGEDDNESPDEARRILGEVVRDLETLDCPVPEDAVERAMGAVWPNDDEVPRQ